MLNKPPVTGIPQPYSRSGFNINEVVAYNSSSNRVPKTLFIQTPEIYVNLENILVPLNKPNYILL